MSAKSKPKKATRVLRRGDDVKLDEEVQIARRGIEAVVHRRAEELEFADAITRA